MSNALLNAIKQIETLQIEALESCSNSAKKVLLEIAIEKTQALKEIISNQPLFSTCDDGALIGERIRKTRKERSLTQADLAEAANVTTQAVCLWENSNTIMAVDKLIPLANALKCDPMWLLTGESSNHQYPATPVHQSRNQYSGQQRSDASDHASHHVKHQSQA
ncbi:helix-turn-helix domain-containing protein [Salmonella enterica subsp. enterica]|uniref:Helix-turn-helix domain-containing protein n=1 Tax=Salmonella enterica subsp. houtenae serovar 45:g,z51:- TaxID=1967611 RepID=A0A736VS39_SALHO|nr:helix-turn-helix domain-containing protein [Salmonella enterica subsp. houtenae str. CFSAN000557]EEM1821112.1 helix-turn-helix domain-containing protein [Salmonella enterica subsp. enterica serovar Abaetetuba]HAE7767714.1 helix-turn-helix domain-containing protein [Salmonella enterica subsp. houtenae serovar 45:g,z51:-]